MRPRGALAAVGPPGEVDRLHVRELGTARDLRVTFELHRELAFAHHDRDARLAHDVGKFARRRERIEHQLELVADGEPDERGLRCARGRDRRHHARPKSAQQRDQLGAIDHAASIR